MYHDDYVKRASLPVAGAPRPESTQRNFPAWHFAMLNDEPRNRAIEAAIAELDLEGKTVFEIGTGTGLVALLFARHGAEHVFTCEMNLNLARVAEEVIAGSPYGDRISLFNVPSHQVIESGLLPGTPDVIFTETVDCGIIGEGYFGIRSDIQQIAGPDTLILPTRIEQHGALVDSPAMRQLNEVSTVCGFDVSALNRFSSRTYYPVRAPLYPFDLLTEWTTVRSYHYDEQGGIRSSIARADRTGVAHGMLTWFSLHFNGYSVSNRPGMKSHWHQAFHPLPEPREVAAGEVFRLQIDDRGAALVQGPLP